MNDIKYMEKVLELAKRGEGYTNPNPLVGAIIVKNGNIIGKGYHKSYGENHAEINAFNNCNEDTNNATMYVNLEPCSHYGKTPPCVNEIIKRGITKVVIGMKDPNPLVSGKGIEILKANKIEVKVGILEDECKRLNEIFIKYISTKMPFCIMKTAMTLDGKIASYSGDSKYITNEYSRAYVHKLRHTVSAIMVGINTIISDNPMLTTRLKDKDGINPIRIIVDSKCKIPIESKVVSLEDNKTIIATTNLADKEKIKILQDMGVRIIITPINENKVDMKYLFKILGDMKIDSVLLEGGSNLNYSVLNENLVDKVISFIAPKMIGGNNAKTPVGGIGKEYIKDSMNLYDLDILRFKEDIMIQGYLRSEK